MMHSQHSRPASVTSYVDPSKAMIQSVRAVNNPKPHIVPHDGANALLFSFFVALLSLVEPINFAVPLLTVLPYNAVNRRGYKTRLSSFG
jgi:hypothetical protein